MQKCKLFFIFSICYLTTFAQQLDSALFSRLHFRFIGPDGNRAIAAVGEIGNPMANECTEAPEARESRLKN